MLAKSSGEVRHAYGVRFGVSIPGVERLCSEIKGLVLKQRLPLHVGNGAANSKYKPEQSRCDDIADRIGLRVKKEKQDSARKIQGESRNHRCESHVVQQRCPE